MKKAYHFRIAIIGTGFSGLGMAIRLKQAGINDFVILERASEIGGTWRDNTYPGCACDIASHLYSFSFAPNPNWTRLYPPQEEIWAYMRQCTEKYKLTPHIRLQCPMQEAEWDNEAGRWVLNTPEGIFTAQFLILGYGPLSEPSLPAIPGLDNFKGTLFHSAQWNHAHKLEGERVAVIGTGASAIQFVPQIQPKVSQLLLFQRTPSWIFPRMDREIPRWQRKLYHYLPFTQKLARARIYLLRELTGTAFFTYKPAQHKTAQQLALKYMEIKVKDPTLRAKLTPTYALGCKRVLISDDFYQSVTKSNVEIITGKIAAIQPHSVVTADGSEYPVDTIICATGFNVAEVPAARLVRGQNGRLLSEVWENGAEAYLGTTVSGFPNMFIMIGPNTGLGHNSMIYMIESQIAYVLDAIRTMDRQLIKVIEVQPKSQAAFNDEIQKQLQKTVWNTGCKSWYLDKNGKNTTIWPSFTFKFRRRLRHFKPAAYILNSK